MRQRSLNWWRNLSQEYKAMLASRYYPDRSFKEVTFSSFLIERIYKNEIGIK